MDKTVPEVHVGDGKPPKEVKWENINLDVERSGTKIVLPEHPAPMTLRAAHKAIERLILAEETPFNISEKVECHFFDGIVAFAKALHHRYGVALSVPTPSFFGKQPPQFVPVRVGTEAEDVVQVPFGRFQLPNVSGHVQTSYALSRGVPVLMITGEIMKRDKDIVMDLVALTKKFSKAESIYKGKAIILDRNESGKLDFNEQLKFFNPHVGKEVPIFDANTDNLIDINIITPIRRADRCRKKGITLKRGILLEGPYGTGKSLVAKQVAKECVDGDWTFISCTEPTALKYALHFAKMYQPCVVFAEDVERIADSRSDEANTLVNDIDGVVSKNDEIMVVFTTNFADRIDKAFLRHGRLDAVISLRAPQAEAIERLVRFYAEDTFPKDAKLNKSFPLMKGMIPASIREVVDRAKLAMVMTNNDTITDDDLFVSATSMLNHLKLMDDAKEGSRPADPVSTAIEKVMDGALKKRIDADYLNADE